MQTFLRDVNVIYVRALTNEQTIHTIKQTNARMLKLYFCTQFDIQTWMDF